MAFGQAAGHSMIGTCRLGDPVRGWTAFDLMTDPAAVLLRDEPTHAVLLAGRTSIADCERSPEATRAVNVSGAFAAAKGLTEAGVKVTVVSSSSVFSRDRRLPLPDDPTDPVCEYGRQKAELEWLCLQLDRVVVVRPTKVLNGASVIDEWVEALASRQPITPFSNLAVSPMRVGPVVSRLLAAVLGAGEPIIHVSSHDDITYAQMAGVVARWLGADPELIDPVEAENDPYRGLITGPFAALGQPFDLGRAESSISAVEHFMAERFG